MLLVYNFLINKLVQGDDNSIMNENLNLKIKEKIQIINCLYSLYQMKKISPMCEFCGINLAVPTILTEFHIIYYNPHRIKLNLGHCLDVSLWTSITYSEQKTILIC